MPQDTDRKAYQIARDVMRHTAHGLGLGEIRHVNIADGPGTGGRLIEIRTPVGINADIALDRGGDLLRLSFRGHEIGWHSATRTPHPWPDSEAEHGLGFLRGFDGFLVTCGLDHHGAPSETSASNMNYPLRSRHVHPLHGRIAAQKAEVLKKHLDWETGEANIILRVQQASVFGEVLELERHYTFALHTPEITITDHIHNRGCRPTRHGILYHFNLGYPFLCPSAQLTGVNWQLRDTLDEDSAHPSDNHVEIVDTAPSPADGTIGLKGGNDTALEIRFDPKMLPICALWRAFQSGTYALGLEPQTDIADFDHSELASGESRCYALSITLSGLSA